MFRVVCAVRNRDDGGDVSIDSYWEIRNDIWGDDCTSAFSS